MKREQTKEPTPTQLAVLQFIRGKLDPTFAPVTTREIGTHFGIKSPNGVMCHLKALEKKGFIKRDVRKKGVRVVMTPDQEQKGDGDGT